MNPACYINLLDTNHEYTLVLLPPKLCPEVPVKSPLWIWPGPWCLVARESLLFWGISFIFSCSKHVLIQRHPCPLLFPQHPDEYRNGALQVQSEWDTTGYHFNLSAVRQLLHGVGIFCVVLQQDRHLECGCLQGPQRREKCKNGERSHRYNRVSQDSLRSDAEQRREHKASQGQGNVQSP